MAKILSGKEVSQVRRQEIADRIKEISEQGRPQPCLAVIQVGEDPASAIYVRNKHKACREAGILSRSIELSVSISEEELLAAIRDLNEDPSVHAILCQLPLPAHIHEERVLESLRPDKDVDGFHPVNVGLLQMGRPCPHPCTAAGILEMLKYYNIELSGKRALVIGRSLIVGKPTAALLLQENATVTIAHSRTRNLPELAREHDLVVVAVGKHHFADASFFKPGAVAIDVGIHHVNGKTEGDIDFASAEPVVEAISPVPGGVGPMTITMLLQNTLDCYERLENARSGQVSL